MGPDLCSSTSITSWVHQWTADRPFSAYRFSYQHFKYQENGFLTLSAPWLLGSVLIDRKLNFVLEGLGRCLGFNAQRVKGLSIVHGLD